MFQKIKSYIIHFLINREMKLQKRTKRVVNLVKAGSIGIVFAMENEDDYQFINRFIHQPVINNRDFKVVCYVPEKAIPNYYIPKLKMDLITKKEINFFEKPKRALVEEFIEKKFDLLIVFSANDHLPVDYIAGCSHAHFKAGYYKDEMVKAFDLMIKKSEEMGIYSFYQTIINYLNDINS
jgi:hypothetical protein